MRQRLDWETVTGEAYNPKAVYSAEVRREMEAVLEVTGRQKPGRGKGPAGFTSRARLLQR